MSVDPRADRIRDFGVTVFAEMSALAAEYSAINLGQGFPDFPGPDWVKDAAQQAIRRDVNQYAMVSGAPRLRRAVARKASTDLERDIDPEQEVTILAGATEALFATMQALVNPGDEVILFEPFYDSYAPDVLMTGGVPRYIPLYPPDADHVDWWYDAAALEGLFNLRTRMILLNTPHNPTGKVYTRAELEHIAALCQKHDVIAVTDEVYEYILFDGREHLRLATFPGMWERTVTISSAGKTFSLTGWKIGWTIASPALSQALRSTQQFIMFCVAAPLQEGIASGLEEAEQRNYYAQLQREYNLRRTLLLDGLRSAGLEPITPRGTYFAMADISQLEVQTSSGVGRDVALCRWLISEVGVAAIPPSYFYAPHHQHLGERFVRFAFCKQEDTLREAARRLARWCSAPNGRSAMHLS